VLQGGPEPNLTDQIGVGDAEKVAAAAAAAAEVS
jgi:hypothetical protein